MIGPCYYMVLESTRCFFSRIHQVISIFFPYIGIPGCRAFILGWTQPNAIQCSCTEPCIGDCYQALACIACFSVLSFFHEEIKSTDTLGLFPEEFMQSGLPDHRDSDMDPLILPELKAETPKLSKAPLLSNCVMSRYSSPPRSNAKGRNISPKKSGNCFKSQNTLHQIYDIEAQATPIALVDTARPKTSTNCVAFISGCSSSRQGTCRGSGWE